MQNLISEHVLTMSSREIAELTEKHHRHVLRDIESMLIDLGEDPEGYAHFWILPQNDQQYREFLLDRDHTECLLTGYSAIHCIRVIKRWYELEELANPFAIPQTYPEPLHIAALRAEEAQHPNSLAS